MKNKNELYSEIETLIIHWNNDGTKTAGYLTRQIMELLEGDCTLDIEPKICSIYEYNGDDCKGCPNFIMHI